MNEYQYSGTSALVGNMAAEAREMDLFPVLIGTEVAHFHDVTGGYNRNHGFNVVNFVHEVQGPDSPYKVSPDQLPHDVEAHLSDNYYYLDVDGIRVGGDYPDENYMLSMRVEGRKIGPQSFTEALSADVDRRETKYE